MSLYDYRISQDVARRDYPFASLIMAAMRQADTNNTEKFKLLWPEIWEELQERYNAVGGILEGDPV